MASPEFSKNVVVGSEGGGSPESRGGSSENNNGAAAEGQERGGDGGGGSSSSSFEYFGWVYHVGINKIGHEFCRVRFLCLRGSYVQMYKRDPRNHPGIKPIRTGVIGHTLMVEELGRRKVSHGDVYVLRFYNRLDEAKKGEIACATAEEAQKWMEAFHHAKKQAEFELSSGRSTRNKLNKENEIDLEGHRPRVRRYANGFKKLIRIGQGLEPLLHQSSMEVQPVGYFEGDAGDAIEAHEWRCVRTINGVRIFEDVAGAKNGKGVLVKAVGVVDASADAVFEVVLNLDRLRRYEWDILTGDLELVDSVNGHYDVVYGTYDPRYLTSQLCMFYHKSCLNSPVLLVPHLVGGGPRLLKEFRAVWPQTWLKWASKRDFVFSRQWFHGQDGTYTILQFPAVHKKRPPKSGYRRTKINPSTWEIRTLNTSLDDARCLVTQMLEINAEGWFGWKNNQSSKFEKTVPHAMLSQVAGLKAYMGANPLTHESSTRSEDSDFSAANDEFVDAGGTEEFYDAIAADSSSEDDDGDNEVELGSKGKKVKLKNVSWAIAGLAVKQTLAPHANKEFDTRVNPIALDRTHYQFSMRQGKDDADTNCWTSPDGSGFKIRGKTYLKDNAKVAGGDPLLKLIAVDWFKVDSCTSNIALHPTCLVQSEAGKKLPFILVFNLQVPAKPNYSLVLYYAADRPVKENSLLGQFVDGTDVFRDSRFKLIPSIKEGYWMVKRAVGTKACLLGKAVTCKYLREDNFLEIDVDVGSSSVARSVIGLVLGYVTSIVVDLAILIEGQEAGELPEYILGTVRLNRVKLESAVPLKV